MSREPEAGYVSPHATWRAIERLRNAKPAGYPELDTTFRVEEWIREQVIAALRDQRCARVKPAWSRMYGEKRRELPRGQWFVWHPDEAVGWIVAGVVRKSDRVTCRVLTTLVRVRSSET